MKAIFTKNYINGTIKLASSKDGPFTVLPMNSDFDEIHIEASFLHESSRSKDKWEDWLDALYALDL